MYKFFVSMLLCSFALQASAQDYQYYAAEPQAAGVHQWDHRTYEMGPIAIPRNTDRWDAPGEHRVTHEGAIWKTDDHTVTDPYGNSVRRRELELFGFLRLPLTTQRSSGAVYYVQQMGPDGCIVTYAVPVYQQAPAYYTAPAPVYYAPQYPQGYQQPPARYTAPPVYSSPAPSAYGQPLQPQAYPAYGQGAQAPAAYPQGPVPYQAPPSGVFANPQGANVPAQGPSAVLTPVPSDNPQQYVTPQGYLGPQPTPAPATPNGEHSLLTLPPPQEPAPREPTLADAAPTLEPTPADPEPLSDDGPQLQDPHPEPEN